MTNRFFNIAQKEYASKRIKETVGDKRTLTELSKDKKHRYNGYTNYLRSVKLPAGQLSSSHWADLEAASHESFAFGGVKRGRDRNKSDAELRQEFFNYGKTGPLGSIDPISPFDFDETYDILHDDYICG